MQSDVEALSNLLNEHTELYEETYEAQTNHATLLHKTSIESTKVKKVPNKTDDNQIWCLSELLPIFKTSKNDRRKQPRYETFYKHNVGTENIFLKNGAENSESSRVVVKIHFPETSLASDLNLEIKDKYLVASSRYKSLLMFFQHNVYAKRGTAKWDKEINVLSVEIPINKSWQY